MVIVFIIVGCILLVGLIFVLARNGIISPRNRVDEAWSGIDVQLKRRHDLVPNLVESVKGYATHERETFEKVTQARAAAMQASGPEEAGQGGDASSARPSADCGWSPSSTRSCARPRTSSSSSASSPSSRTRSRPRAGSTTPTSSPTTPGSSSSPARSSPTRAASPPSPSSRSATPPSARRRRSPSNLAPRPLGLEPARPEAARPRGASVERVGLERAGGGDRARAGAGRSGRRGAHGTRSSVGVQEQHPDLAPVARVDQPGRVDQGDAVLERQTRSAAGRARRAPRESPPPGPCRR